MQINKYTFTATNEKGEIKRSNVFFLKSQLDNSLYCLKYFDHFKPTEIKYFDYNNRHKEVTYDQVLEGLANSIFREAL